MSGAAEHYAAAAEAFGRVLRGVTAGAWSAASPCEGWTAHDVAEHVVETHRRVLTRLTGGDPAPPDSGEDLVAAWDVESGAVLAAVADPGRAATSVQGMGAEQRFDELVGTLLTADTLLHTWDLARASGQDERLDPAVVAATHAFLLPFDSAFRVPGGFGPAVDPPPGADPQTRLLCFVGRRP